MPYTKDKLATTKTSIVRVIDLEIIEKVSFLSNDLPDILLKRSLGTYINQKYNKTAIHKT